MEIRHVRMALFVLLAAALAFPISAAEKNEKRKKDTPATESNKKLDSKNVNELFRDARKLFDDEKYVEATVAFNRIVKKYPTHQPSLLLYARSLYKLEKLNEAYYLFSRVNPQLLEPDGAYEYGQVFYAKQQYAPALAAFQKVPANHSFADLARYYGGICAVKLKQYELAEDLMSKALVLPEREAKSRGLYLKHITKLRELKQKQSLSAERVQERARLKAELDAAEKSGPATPAAGAAGAAAVEPIKATAPTAYEHKGFESVDKKVELGLKSSVQNVQNDAFSEAQAEVSQVFLSVLGGAVLPFSANVSAPERRAAIGMQLVGKGTEDRQKGALFIQTRETDSSPVVRRLQTPQKSTTRVGEFTLNLWSEFPLQNDYWTSITANYYIYAPDFVRRDRTGSRAGILKIGQKKERYSILGSGSVTESFDRKSVVEQTAYHADVTMSYKINDELSSDFTGGFENYDYAVDTIDGPDSLSSAILSLSHSMPLNFNLSFKGTYEFLQNYVAHNMPSFGQISAEGQNLKGQIVLGAVPLPWLRASLYGKIRKSKFYVADPEQQKVFDINVQNFLSEYGASIGVNLFF